MPQSLLVIMNIVIPIKRSYDNTKAGMSSTISHFFWYKINGSYISPQAISKTLEDFFKIPVETEIPTNQFFEIEINIENRVESETSWQNKQNASR